MPAGTMSLSKDLLSWEPVKMLTPSTPTSTVATLELSTLDLLFDRYTSVLLFYDVAAGDGRHPNQCNNTTEPVRRLQQALEEMLAHYPCAAGMLVYNEMAGRLEVRYPCISSTHEGHGNSPTHENPPLYGVPFHVAHANVALADLGDVSLPQPSLDLLYPSKPPQHQQLDSKGHPLPRFVMAFQVTTFICGGFTVAHTCNHAYADGHTGAAFLQNLCSIARGSSSAAAAAGMAPRVSRRGVICPREPPSPTMPFKYIQARKRSTEGGQQCLPVYGTGTRFKFTMDSLEALRASCVSQAYTFCSRNQALVALLWTAFASVSLKVHGLPGSHEMQLGVPINVRTRGLASMEYMGNALCLLSVTATLQELCNNSLSYVVDKIKKTMNALDLNESLQSMVDHIELQLRDGLTPVMEGLLNLPSLVGLPFYDTDCGWGPPIYVGRPSQQLSHCCVILEHPTAKAWNVLVVFASSEEHACFQESIAKYTS